MPNLIPQTIELVESKTTYPSGLMWHNQTRIAKLELSLVNKPSKIIEQVVHEFSEITICMVALPMVCETVKPLCRKLKVKSPFGFSAFLLTQNLNGMFPRVAKRKAQKETDNILTFIDLMLIPQHMIEQLER